MCEEEDACGGHGGRLRAVICIQALIWRGGSGNSSGSAPQSVSSLQEFNGKRTMLNGRVFDIGSQGLEQVARSCVSELIMKS